jgi:hypothetical protein
MRARGARVIICGLRCTRVVATAMMARAGGRDGEVAALAVLLPLCRVACPPRTSTSFGSCRGGDDGDGAGRGADGEVAATPALVRYQYGAPRHQRRPTTARGGV